MSRIRRRIVGQRRAASIVALLALSLAGVVSACELRVQVPSMESFGRASGGSARDGYAVEVMREALGRIGCAPAFVEFPGARAWSGLENGELAILFGARPRPEREAFARFIGPLDHVRLTLYVRRAAMPDAPLRTLADVRGTRLRIGIERLSSYGPEYDALLEDEAFLQRLRITVSREAGLAMLESGRLDAVFADAPSADALARRGIDVVPVVPLSPVPIHLAIGKAAIDESRHAALQAALDAMAEDGTLDHLREAAAIESMRTLPGPDAPGSDPPSR